jgi:hypothetical protein
MKRSAMVRLVLLRLLCTLCVCLIAYRAVRAQTPCSAGGASCDAPHTGGGNTGRVAGTVNGDTCIVGTNVFPCYSGTCPDANQLACVQEPCNASNPNGGNCWFSYPSAPCAGGTSTSCMTSSPSCLCPAVNLGPVVPGQAAPC